MRVSQKLTRLKIIVMGDNFEWAKADTIEEAAKIIRNPKKYVAFLVHPDSTVTGMGAVTYPDGFAPKVISRKGHTVAS